MWLCNLWLLSYMLPQSVKTQLLQKESACDTSSEECQEERDSGNCLL